MIPINSITGRLGNQMFEFAALYSFAKEQNVDFYFQDEKWFKKYEEDIKNMFGEGIGFLPFISIHVRRGDYVNNPFYVDLSKTDYYEQAIKHFPDRKFLVFSDDTEFAQKLFPDINKFQVIQDQTEIEDFNMASSCEGHIIANSSFSWWYAWLSPSPHKKIIAPSVKNWYSDGIERTKCPESWIRI